MNASEYTPSHPGLFKVEFSTDPTTHSSRLVAIKLFKPHEVLATIRVPLNSSRTGDSNQRPAPKNWSTIQISQTRHLETNSDLLYMNHSCDPSAIVKVTPGLDSISIIAGSKGISPGKAITFFYPSTEWEMSRPFECFCGSEDCLKVVRGAKYLESDILKRWFINEHIWDQKRGVGMAQLRTRL